MTDNDLLTLAEREANRLDGENDHGAAIIIRELANRVRELKPVRDFPGKSSITDVPQYVPNYPGIFKRSNLE
jgi:hypothetical protein